jgi:tripartite-type tricarboxylate transporter receptor subunit TctC
MPRLAILLLLLLPLWSSAAHSEWPERPLRFVLPFTAGGATDVVIRIAAQRLGTALDRQVVVDNRTGASGNIGTELVAHAAPDGYTFLVGTPATLAINPALFRTIPYDPVSDFTIVSQVARFPQALGVHPAVPATSVAALIALARAKPGALNFGSSGNGSTGHMMVEMLKSLAGIQLSHIPYRGGADAVRALAAGEVELVIDGLPSFTGQMQAGSVRVLAVTTAQRWPGSPDLPSIGETVPGYDASAWVLLAAPARTPSAIIERLSALLAASVTAPEVRQRLFEVGAEPVGSNPADATAFHRAELEKWRRVVGWSGAKVD